MNGSSREGRVVRTTRGPDLQGRVVRTTRGPDLQGRVVRTTRGPDLPGLVVDVSNRSAGRSGERALKSPRLRAVEAALRAAARLAAGRFGGDPGAFGRAVNVAWVRDVEMRQLNRRLCGKPGTTDVLAWCGGCTNPETGLPCPGEIVCNLELARSSSREHGNSIEAEAVLYAVHGLVHLLGGEDETARGRERMREVEVAALAAAGLEVRGGEWE